jgi:hypothetical protein
VEIHVDGLDARVLALEGARSRPRGPEDSWHQYDEDAEEVRLLARAKVKDPRLPSITPERVRSIFARAKREIQEEGELDTYRRIKTLAWKITQEVAKVALPSALGALAYHVWRLLHP